MIDAFNSLKGVLAIMIFIHHLDLYNGGGSLAVAVFFMLGGFLSTLGYRDKILSTGFCYKNYLLCKAIKFYPLHWLLLLIVIPFIFYGGGSLLKNLLIFIINASLLQSWIPIPSVYFSGNSVSWYLSDTLAFVVVFPFLLKWMLHGAKISKISVAIGIVIVYIIFCLFIPHDYTHRLFYINPMFRIVDYMVGMAVALLYLHYRDTEGVKEYVARKINLLIFFTWLCFIGLIFISLANNNLVLHSIVYIPLSAIMLILIALTGGGFYAQKFSKSLG